MKPAPPPTGNGIRRMMNGGPGTDSPGHIDYSNVTLRGLIGVAYNVKDFQISAPDWVSGEGYDILAKVPPHTTKEQFAPMLRSLLAERFHLVVHRDTKELPVYALIVAKNGPKLKEVEDGPGVQGLNMRSSPAGTRIWGKMRLADLAASLSNALDRPVLDMAGLPGIYDIDIAWMPDEAVVTGGASGMLGSTEKVWRVDSNAATSIFAALQDICGLKVEARKSQIETIVVDRVEKVPTEN